MKLAGAHRWLVVLAYVALIYATIPYAPTLWLRASALTGLELRTLALSILLVAGGLVLIGVMRAGLTRTGKAALIGLACIYAGLYRYQFDAPAERLHLLEYGLLPWLVYWAWSPGRGWIPHAAGSLAVSFAVGILDEVMQGITPGRYAELRDVASNWESALLGLALLLIAEKPWQSPIARMRGLLVQEPSTEA